MSLQSRVTGTLIALTMLSGSLLFGDNSLSITNYQEVSEQRLSRTQSYFTYSATLVNNGPALGGAVATLTSLSPSVQVVAGQGTLHFGPVAAGGQVPSKDTFTILVDSTVAFSFSSLQWTFGNPVANAGPNQTVAVGANVTLNGSGSSNPSGTGTLTYSWAFVSKPAGSSAVLTNANTVTPSFTVDAAGSYVISLTVNNGTGTDSTTVTVSTGNTPPVANAGANQTVAVGATVVLDGSGSHDADGDPLTYFWTLLSAPRGSAAFIANFRSVSSTFVADQAGSYVVQLVVNDGQVDSVPATVTITTAANTPPVANAGPNQTVGVGALVHLDGSQSTDVDGHPLIYKWSLISLPRGSVAQLSNPGAVAPTFTADQAGTYIAQLIVSDNNIDSTPSTVTITTNTSVQAPTANAGLNQTVALGTVVTLNGSGTDPQGLPLTFSWSLITRPAGSIATLSATNIAKPTFVLDLPGSYVAQLIVNNGTLSSAPSTVTITTANTPPVANAGPAQSVTVGTLVTLDGSGSFDADHNPLTYSWSFLNTPAGSATTLQGAHSVSPTFIADVAGPFVVQLIVNDGFVDSPPVTVTVTVGNGGSSGIVLPATFAVAPGQTLPYPVSLASPAASTIVVSLTDSDPTKATLSQTSLTFTAGQTQPSRPPNITGVANGTVTITAQATGFAAATGQVAVGLSATLSPANLTIQSPATDGTETLTLSAPGQNSVTFTLTSSNPSVASVPPSVPVSAGTQVISFKVTRGLQGTAVITASAPGFADATANVTVPTPNSISLSVSNTSLQLGNTATATITLSSPAPFGGASVTVTSSTAGTTISPATVVIPQGSTTGTTQITAVNVGSPSITASAPGYTPSSPVVLQIGATIAWVPPTVTIPAIGQQVLLQLRLFATVPGSNNFSILDGLSINLNSSNSAVATVPPTVNFFWDGSNVPTLRVPVTSVAPGTALIHASGINIPDVVATVTVTGPLAITTTSLPNGPAGAAYQSAVVASGGTTPYLFSATGLPANLSINSATGQITGNPAAPGSSTVSVTVTDSSSPVQTVKATYTLAITAATPNSIAVVSGTPQSAAINTAFAPLVVLVKNTLNNPMAGATVTFAVPGSGASATLSSSTATTDATGKASITATANTTAGGPYTVAATVAGVAAAANFALTNTPGAPAKITVIGGSPQSVKISTPFANALQVQVLDAGSNPVPGATVTFAAPGSGASTTLSSTTATTDVNGKASVTATANATAGGPYTVTATVAGVAGAASFALTNTPGAPAKITVIGGSPQSAKISTPFANALQVQVLDAGSNPVPGATVTFAAPGSGASATLSSTTATTDANGKASVTATANATAGGPYTVTATVAGVVRSGQLRADQYARSACENHSDRRLTTECQDQHAVCQRVAGAGSGCGKQSGTRRDGDVRGAGQRSERDIIEHHRDHGRQR